MRILGKFKEQYDDWQIRKSAKIRLELLVSSITKHLQQLKGRDDVYSRVALRHAERADRNYKHALEHYADEDFEECLDYIEKGELHIHFAHLQMAPQDAEYDPGFAEGSVQWILDCFCQAITQTKMAIEYMNCKLSDMDRKDLITCASLYTQSLRQLKEEENETARSIAEAGLLLLHATVRNINIDNQGRLAEIRLPRITGSAWVTAKDLSDQINNCKQQFALDTTLVSEKARHHLRGAELQFRLSIDRLINGDEKAGETAASAGSIEAKFAEGMISTQGSQTAETPSSESIRAADFERTLARLRRLLKRTQTKNHESAEKHLAASQRYLSDAIAQLENSNTQEASRLARAAYLDLDYARQLIVSDQPPKYIDP